MAYRNIDRETHLYYKLDPVITRCFHTKQSELPDQYFERISHCYELEYIPWGRGAVITDGVHIPAVAGTVFFRKPGMKIHGILPYSSYGILMDSIAVEDLPLVSNFASSHTISFLFQDVYASYLSSDPLEQLKMKADVLQIIYYLKANQSYQEKQKENSAIQYHLEQLNYLTEYIDARLATHITLEELARVCNISPSFLCRLFKQAFNETLFSYLNRRRMQEAKRLLIETTKPIKDICICCGFRNESYFYRAFKQSVQMTPSDFRKIHQQSFWGIPMEEEDTEN